MNNETEWDEIDKAWWILQNGPPKVSWIYELVNDRVYRRPSIADVDKVPPWISMERQLVKTVDNVNITGRTAFCYIQDDVDKLSTELFTKDSEYEYEFYNEEDHNEQ